jgi:hypothetical protein
MQGINELLGRKPRSLQGREEATWESSPRLEERQAPVGDVERRQGVMRRATKSTIINRYETRNLL